jgi:Uma2 family endonuclease
MPCEIIAPYTEPETEWVRGRFLQKVSPTRPHALLQRTLATALAAWAHKRGEVGTEWRFRITPPGGPERPLVPDVAYVALERLRGLRGYDLDVPRLSPDVVVEVLSPQDRRLDVDDKIATYLDAGTQLVIIVDPRAHVVELHDTNASRAVREGGMLRHRALPDFALSITELFEVIAPPS